MRLSEESALTLDDFDRFAERKAVLSPGALLRSSAQSLWALELVMILHCGILAVLLRAWATDVFVSL